MFTQRAALLGFVAFCFYLIAVVNSLPAFYYVLTWLTLGLSLASLGLAFMSLSGLETQWSFLKTYGQAALSPHHPAPEDAAPTFEISFQNNASLGKTGLVLELHFIREGELKSKAQKGRGENISSHSFLIEAIAAGQSLQVTVPLRFLPRGEHRLHEIRLIGSDVLGVFRVSRRLKWEGESPILLVAPAILEDSSTTLAHGAGRALSGTQRARALGRGDEIRGTRAYGSGDDLRHIHWKTTARTGQLAVREWEQTGRAAALLIWNGASDSALLSEVGLCLCASLCAVCGRSNTPRALAVLGQESVWIGARENMGRHLSGREIEALARAQFSRKTPFLTAISGLEMSGYDAIYLIGGAANEITLASQVESWLARGAHVTVLWLEEIAPKKRGKKVESEIPNPTAEKLEKIGARVLRLTLENGAFEEEKLRELLLRVAIS